MIRLDDATAAATLLRFVLQGRPLTDGSDYGLLYRQYRTDATFRELVDAVASGLGLVVLGSPPTGMVLSPNEGSPFDFRLTDLRPSWTADERLVAGLVLLGIAALKYPREEDLDEVGSPKILSIDQVEKFMRDAIKPIAATEAEVGSIESYAASAAEAYERMPGVLRTEKKGQRKRGCTTKVVADVFDLLAEQKLARPAPRYGKDAYVLTDRFRVQVGTIAGSEALKTMRGLAPAHQAVEV
jgi:hypothetical protein